MKIKLMILLTVIFAIGIGAIIVYIPLKQQKDRLAAEAQEAAAKSKALDAQVKSMQNEEGKRLQEEKTASLEQKSTGPVFFSAKSTPLAGGDTQIDITLDGEKSTSVDAIDLVIAYPPTVTVKEVKKGTTFPSYPRAFSKDGSITVTGIAMPSGSGIVYGNVGTVFATIILTKKPADILELNTKDTQAYFNGTPILDFTRSFKQL